MLNALLSRWKRPGPAAGLQIHSDSTLPSAPMPEHARPGDSLLQSILRWLPGEADPWGGTAKPALKPARLPQIKADFMACLSGLAEVDELRRSIQRARCLRDFWHLRGTLYTEVARSFSQAEAESRLAALAPHFRDYQAALRPSTRRH